MAKEDVTFTIGADGSAMALVDSSSAAPGTELQVLINHIAIPAKVEKSTSCDFRETC